MPLTTVPLVVRAGTQKANFVPGEPLCIVYNAGMVATLYMKPIAGVTGKQDCKFTLAYADSDIDYNSVGRFLGYIKTPSGSLFVFGDCFGGI